MQKNIFIPKQCKVGFRERRGTFNGKLGFVIYKQGNVWKQETSWSDWIEKNKKEDASFNPVIFDNVPMEGFVLNKKAGGGNYGWNNRNTYCRVYDPRGFEIEISIDNLLYILDYTNSIIGKGLEGSFIYGWSGKNLVLIPCNSPDYEIFVEFSEVKGTKINVKKLVAGGIYLSSLNQKVMFISNHNNKYWIYDYRMAKIYVKDSLNLCKHIDTDISFYNSLYQTLIVHPEYIGIKDTIYTPITTTADKNYNYFYYNNNLYQITYNGYIYLVQNHRIISTSYEKKDPIYKYYDQNKDTIQYHKRQYLLNDNTIIDTEKYNEIRH